jgi:hypothetical protein
MPNIIKDAQRIDKALIIGSIKKTDDGYLQGNAVVARSGILEYYENGKVVRELVTDEELAKADSLLTLKMKPVTNGHPSVKVVTSQNVKQFQVGFTGENVVCEDGRLVTPITINDNVAITDVEANKRRQLSCGYICDEIEEPGEWNGQPYDRKQTNRRYNHVALCDHARAGSVASLHLDASDVYECGEPDFKENKKQNKIDNQPQKRSRPMPVTIKIDGIDYPEQAPEVAKRIEKLDADIKTAQAATAAIQTKLDAMTADRDATKVKLDAANVEIATFPTKVVTASKARADLVAIAKPHLDKADQEKIDTLTDAQIKKAVALKAFPASKVKIDAVKEDALDAVNTWFDAAIEHLKNDVIDTAARQNRQDSVGVDKVHVDGCQCDACANAGKSEDINEHWKKNKEDSFAKKGK